MTSLYSLLELQSRVSVCKSNWDKLASRVDKINKQFYNQTYYSISESKPDSNSIQLSLTNDLLTNPYETSIPTKSLFYYYILANDWILSHQEPITINQKPSFTWIPTSNINMEILYGTLHSTSTFTYFTTDRKASLEFNENDLYNLQCSTPTFDILEMQINNWNDFFTWSTSNMITIKKPIGTHELVNTKVDFLPGVANENLGWKHQSSLSTTYGKGANNTLSYSTATLYGIQEISMESPNFAMKNGVYLLKASLWIEIFPSTSKNPSYAGEDDRWNIQSTHSRGLMYRYVITQYGSANTPYCTASFVNGYASTDPWSSSTKGTSTTKSQINPVFDDTVTPNQTSIIFCSFADVRQKGKGLTYSSSADLIKYKNLYLLEPVYIKISDVTGTHIGLPIIKLDFTVVGFNTDSTWINSLTCKAQYNLVRVY